MPPSHAHEVLTFPPLAAMGTRHWPDSRTPTRGRGRLGRHVAQREQNDRLCNRWAAHERTSPISHVALATRGPGCGMHPQLVGLGASILISSARMLLQPASQLDDGDGNGSRGHVRAAWRSWRTWVRYTRCSLAWLRGGGVVGGWVGGDGKRTDAARENSRDE